MRQAALEEVHEQKGEIVEDIAGADQRAEFDGVEQDRSALDHRDIAEMKIAMDAPDETAPAALDQEGPDAPIDGAARAPQRFHLCGREELRRLAERGDVLGHIGAHRVDPRLRLDRRRPRVRGRHDAAQEVGQRGVDASLIRQMIEGERLVEAAHLDRPFDRLAAAPERVRSVRLARDRHHPR